MMRIFTLLLVVLATACSGGLFDMSDGDPRSIPTNLTMPVPHSMQQGTKQGTAGEKLAEALSESSQVLETLQNELRFIASYQGSFIIGETWEHPADDNTIWVYFDNNDTNGYYLYYGTVTGITNVYLSWRRMPLGGVYQGKAVWLTPDEVHSIEKAAVEFDQYNETLDLHLLYNDESYRHIEMSDSFYGLTVKVFTDLFDAANEQWHVKAYADHYGPGGAMAKNNLEENHGEETHTNFRFEGYFNYLGNTGYAFEEYDVYTDGEFSQTVTNIEYGDANGLNPGIQSTLNSINYLNGGSFPEWDLP